jgi:hypothetical protein
MINRLAQIKMAKPWTFSRRGNPMAKRRVGKRREPVKTSARALDLLTKGARDGAGDARAAATRTWDATSQIASRFVYSTCFTVSYGVVFPVVLLARVIPRNNEAVRAMIDGAHAAIRKVDQLTPALSPA